MRLRFTSSRIPLRASEQLILYDSTKLKMVMTDFLGTSWMNLSKSALLKTVACAFFSLSLPLDHFFFLPFDLEEDWAAKSLAALDF